MPSPRDIAEFASDPNWITFGQALAKAIQAPQEYGYNDHRQLQLDVANSRNVDEASLRNPLAAVNWLEQHAPEALKKENASRPMTGVLLLAQISLMDGDLAKSLTREFFSGELNKSDLKAHLQNLQSARGGRGVTAHDRVKQAAAFEDEVLNYLKTFPEALELSRSVQVVKCERSARVPCDFIVTDGDDVIAGVEVKAHRQKTHRRYLLDVFAMTALIAREYRLGFLIVPSSWGKAVGELSQLVQSLGIDEVKLGVFEHGTGLKLVPKAKTDGQPDKHRSA